MCKSRFSENIKVELCESREYKLVAWLPHSEKLRRSSKDTIIVLFRGLKVVCDHTEMQQDVF